MSPRQAATIVASAIANRIVLEVGARLPRRLEIAGRDFIIENGVGCDMLSSGMVQLVDSTPKYEVLGLTEDGYRYVLQKMDNELLVDAGILLPQ
ncbi:MAG TPA: hypothetical protein VGF56_04035 [Rhizomicrobium sp.]|jgi:hypothetical protein